MKRLSDTYVESVIRAFAKWKMTARQAVAMLGITRQYANRLRKAYAEEGPHEPIEGWPRDGKEAEAHPGQITIGAVCGQVQIRWKQITR